jgi:hypothetical protein
MSNPMGTHSVVEKILSEHGSAWWDDGDRGIYADDILDHSDVTDPGSVAHSLWSMGASKPADDGPFHAGCHYDDPDGAHGGDYENSCEPCKEWLAELSEKVVDAARAGSIDV